jgi:alkanesulfonate monooxygenase SsuD/methylene tetrahydromethanopterin reductase-like flavin-dependent oxidoreductase (luciferase family)
VWAEHALGHEQPDQSDVTAARRRRKIGVQLPEVERVVRWDEVRRMAVLAEDAGFDSLWVGDHYLYRGPTAADARGPWERGRSSPRSPQ